MAPYTPPSIMSPVLKGSDLIWRVNLPSTYWACLSNVGLTAGAKSALISPKYRRGGFYRKVCGKIDANRWKNLKSCFEGFRPQKITVRIKKFKFGIIIGEIDSFRHINIGWSYQAFVDENLSYNFNDPTDIRSRVYIRLICYWIHSVLKIVMSCVQ